MSNKRKAQETDNTLDRYFSSSRKAPRKTHQTGVVPAMSPTLPSSAKTSESSTSPDPIDADINTVEINGKKPNTKNDTKHTQDQDDETPSEDNKISPEENVTTTTTTPQPPNTIKITEKKGDIFSAPPKTLLIHACNCQGTWGAGIALAFKKHYPFAYNHYTQHCKSSSPQTLLGSALLIPPSRTGPEHYVGCLFTSRSKGRFKDSPAEILESTKVAMRELLREVGVVGGVREIWMCKINSGLFGVPWEDTKEVIESLSFEGGLTITVVERS